MDLEKIKTKNYQLLKQKKQTIEKQLSELRSQDPFSDPDRTTDNALETDAQEETDHDRIAAITAELESKQAQVNSALNRIETGEYFRCSVCGRSIKLQRLQANPSADKCVECS